MLNLQQQLVRAYKAKDKGKVLNLQRQIVTRFAARALAVRRVTLNKDGKTPGVDGEKWPTPKSRIKAIKQLNYITQNPNLYRAHPVRRVEIPKPGKAEKRPLGIPTLIDRAVQAVYLSSIDPIAEETGDENSFGFRPYRGAREAIIKRNTLLGRDHSPTWILDADIRKCFDTINHQWLLDNVPIGDKAVLESWLKSGVETLSGLEATTSGVPLSPALCNITLNGIEDYVRDATKNMVAKNQNTKVHLVRYADDFIVTATNSEILRVVEQKVSEFLVPRGLELHPLKTRQLELMQQEFEFLGFEISKHPLDLRLNQPSLKNTSTTRLSIRPSKSNRKQLVEKVKTIITSGRPIGSIVRDLNPVLRGWSNYFRITRQSQRVFKFIGNWAWFKMLRWAQARHSNRNIAWIKSRYLAKSKWRSNHWCNKRSKGNPYIIDISTVAHLFVPLMKRGLNCYEHKDRLHLEARALQIARKGEKGLRKVLIQRDQGICLVCHTSLINSNENVELHHLTPQKQAGGWTYDNLVLLHTTCHKKVTYDEVLNQNLKSQICREPVE